MNNFYSQILHIPNATGIATRIQPYTTTGKELDTHYSLNWLNFGARQYMPDLGQWNRVDDLCEKYYPTGPYVYCGANPVKYIDENGDSIIVNRFGNIINRRGKDNGVYLFFNSSYQKIGNLDGVIDANYIYTNLLNKNIREAKRMWSPFTFRNKVKTGGSWDLKNDKNTIWGYANDNKTTFLFEGMKMKSQDIGNHHFGVVAKALGLFTDYLILSQAGKYQIESGTSKPEWQKFSVVETTRFSPSGVPYTTYTRTMLPPYGDDPMDQMWIKLGFDYWKRNY